MATTTALYVKHFLLCLAGLLAFALCILAPYSLWWLYASGDAAVERVVEKQARADFALFGSALSQDFADYKLRLYAAAKPEIIAIGSSRVMQFRGAWFSQSFLNLGGVAGNLGMLRATVDEILALGRPKAMIIGLDFWWFLPQWEDNPDQKITLGADTYNYDLDSLKKPWQWLGDGKISLREFIAPVIGIFGHGFRTDRYGIMAQQSGNGFGPDGSWYYTAEVTGLKPAPDYHFRDTLQNIRQGSRAFYHARAGQNAPAPAHLEALAELWCRLKSRGIQIFAFIPPLASAVLAEMPPLRYPHLFRLKAALAAHGIDALDFSNARAIGSGDCEFVDGFHGGEVTYARILQRMADHWPPLLAYVHMEKLENIIRDWQGNAFVPDARVTGLPEQDFLGLNCPRAVHPVAMEATTTLATPER